MRRIEWRGGCCYQDKAAAVGDGGRRAVDGDIADRASGLLVGFDGGMDEALEKPHGAVSTGYRWVCWAGGGIVQVKPRDDVTGAA